MGVQYTTIRHEFEGDWKTARMVLSVYARDKYDQGGNSDYERLAPTDRDRDFFLTQWKTAASEVATILVERVLRFVIDDTAGPYMELDLRMYGEPFDDSGKEGDLADYMRNSMISAWLKQKEPDAAKDYEDAKQRAMTEMTVKVFHNPRPRLKYFNH